VGVQAGGVGRTREMARTAAGSGSCGRPCTSVDATNSSLMGNCVCTCMCTRRSVGVSKRGRGVDGLCPSRTLMTRDASSRFFFTRARSRCSFSSLAADSSTCCCASATFCLCRAAGLRSAAAFLLVGLLARPDDLVADLPALGGVPFAPGGEEDLAFLLALVGADDLAFLLGLPGRGRGGEAGRQRNEAAKAGAPQPRRACLPAVCRCR